MFKQAKWTYPFAALLALIPLVAAACGEDDFDAFPTPITGGFDYSSLDGEVRIDGSSTVFPISAAVSEEFSRIARSVKVPVGSSGTGGGFQKFCRGDIAIADASRPINQTEKDACAAEGITAADIVELQVALDALTVVVNRDNTWANCMTTAQLTKAFQSGGARKWSDIGATDCDQPASTLSIRVIRVDPWPIRLCVVARTGG